MSESYRAGMPSSPAEAFEALALLSHTLSQSLAASTILTNRGLSLEAFAMLAAMAGDKTSPLGKIAKRATPNGKASRGARTTLISAGFIEASPDGRARSYVVTEKGMEALAAIRAEGGEAAKNMSDRALRAVPRVASMVRDLAQVLRPARASEGTEQAAEA